MSNIAVITLSDSSNKKGGFKRFLVEDNIGEAIHLHVDNMRVDFTVDEFLAFSEIVRSSLVELDLLYGYELNSFDEHFLKESANLLPDLSAIRVKKIKLSKLKCIVNISWNKSLTLQRLLPVTKVPAYLYLNGSKAKFKKYHQFNYASCSNEERLESILESIKLKGYPYQSSYIVLFKGENIIRDGQHRAAVLAYLYGPDFEVDIQEFDFNGRQHTVHVYLNNLKAIFVWGLRETYRKVKRVVKSLR